MTKDSKSLELESYMANFYGTEQYYKYLGFLKFMYTDGVRGFAQKAGAYWFLDQVFGTVLKMKQGFIEIHLIVKDEKADILYKSNGKLIKKVHIPYTDCPEGDWVFFFDNEWKVLMWHGEY